MDYLNSILERKRADLKKILPLEGKLRASAIQRNDYAGFRTAVDLGENRLSVVPEMSRVHPVLNLRESNQDLRHLYGMFIQGGAQGISIAVEPEVYGGSWDMVSTISRISTVPVMARDVFIHPAMICQAIVSGADAVNLVAAALPEKDLEDLYRMASGLGLDVMMEVHTLNELETAMDLEAEFVCINNADPHTLQANPAVTEKLIEEIPASVTVLAAGGIRTVEDARRMLDAGANGVILPRISWKPFWRSGRNDFSSCTIYNRQAQSVPAWRNAGLKPLPRFFQSWLSRNGKGPGIVSLSVWI